ncbi:MAG: hypothetical protein Q9183_001100 [Haloplaca sp. 2 TL-2023]
MPFDSRMFTLASPSARPPPGGMPMLSSLKHTPPPLHSSIRYRGSALFHSSSPFSRGGRPQRSPLVKASELSHLTESSEVHQISIGHKEPTQRAAIATGYVSFSNVEPLHLIKEHLLEKGDVMAVARVAGIMAVKNTSMLIPLAHSGLALEGCSVALKLLDQDGMVVDLTPKAIGGRERENLRRGPLPDKAKAVSEKEVHEAVGKHGGVFIRVRCQTTGKTGVEMEAMSGVMGAALTVVDMCKSADKHITIEQVEVIGKKGGKSGDWGVYANLP